MTGLVAQVNISRGGVPKRPISAGNLTPEGIEGDSQAHPDIHGGPRQAVLLVTAEGIDELAAAGFPVSPGALGENITTRGIPRGEGRVGQRWRIGTDATIEITKRRAPCAALNVYGPKFQASIFDALANAGDPTSPKWGLSGFYASVVVPGVIRPGDSVVACE